MNKRLGKWQMGVGGLILIMGLLALSLQPVIALCVVLYGIYVVYVGWKIKNGTHSLKNKNDSK